MLGFFRHCELSWYPEHPASFEDLPAFSFNIESVISVTLELIPGVPLQSWPLRVIIIGSW